MNQKQMLDMKCQVNDTKYLTGLNPTHAQRMKGQTLTTNEENE